MYFSGKITNSFVSFLDRQLPDQERLFELTHLPTEFLRDSSCWLKAQDVENFLEVVEQEYGARSPEGPLVTWVGHQCVDLKAWGVLDSVLRMMQKPQDIYAQPQRFISYFVSPAPPIGNLQKEEDGISFDLPISNQEFPLVTEYLRAALEALPLYVGKGMASARWTQNKIRVSWSENQKSFLGQEEMGLHFRPEFVQSLVDSLESAQRELEARKKDLLLKDQELVELKRKKVQEGALTSEQKGPLRDNLNQLRSQVMRLADYLSRSQQLVTLLVGQGRMDRQVQEAMRRVDWDFVRSQFPQVTKQAIGHIEKVKEVVSQGPVSEVETAERSAVTADLFAQAQSPRQS